jgi:NAD(P)-dependent dehydrogenase (short-subunit alcohol dehydrogenase family)
LIFSQFLVVILKYFFVKNKIIVITGGTSGVGKATVVKLASFGSKVVILARNKNKAELVLKEIKKSIPDAQLDFVETNLSSLKSVAKAAEQILLKYKTIDVLINNAGGVFSEKEITEDGFETAFQVNHLSHFLLTQLLLPSLLSSPQSRVINLSSEAHRIGSIDFSNLNGEKKFSTWKQYGATKLMNVIHAKGLANRYSDKGLMAFSLHPGVVRTEFGSNNGGLLGYFNKMPFLITPEKGAETSIYLASQEAFKLQNGGYYKKSMIAYSSLQSQDLDIQEELWNVSMELLKSKGYLKEAN